MVIGARYTARFNLVMQPDERAMLEELAKEMGLKESDVVRQLVRREYAAKFGNKPPPTEAAAVKAPKKTKTKR
jgi:hypothetical protein